MQAVFRCGASKDGGSRVGDDSGGDDASKAGGSRVGGDSGGDGASAAFSFAFLLVLSLKIMRKYALHPSFIYPSILSPPH